jgi:hypothetical protein
MMDGRDRPSLKTGTLMQVSIVKTNPEGTEAAAQSIGYVVLLATTAAISGFLFGFDTAVINGVLLFLRRQFTLSNLQTEVAASSLLLGCLRGRWRQHHRRPLWAQKVVDLLCRTVCCFISGCRGGQHGRPILSCTAGGWTGHRRGFCPHAGVHCRNLSIEPSRGSGFDKSIGNRNRDFVGISCQLAIVAHRGK